MGTQNKKLLIDWSKAVRKGNTPEAERLNKLIEETQRRCPHDREKRWMKFPTDKDSKNGKIKTGDFLEFCILCGHVTRIRRGEEILQQQTG
jgi:hypothetical protein